MSKHDHNARVLASISSVRDCLLFDLAGQQLCARLTGTYQTEFSCDDREILQEAFYVI